MAAKEYIDEINGLKLFAERAEYTESGVNIDNALDSFKTDTSPVVAGDNIIIDRHDGNIRINLVPVSGPTGPDGAQGPTGTRGPCGPSGYQGITGAKGPCGPSGNKGPCGPSGNQGATGSKGPCGPSGNRGPCGPSGNNGITGACGPRGAGFSSISFTSSYSGVFTPSSTATRISNFSASNELRICMYRLTNLSDTGLEVVSVQFKNTTDGGSNTRKFSLNKNKNSANWVEIMNPNCAYELWVTLSAGTGYGTNFYFQCLHLGN